jgi:threonine/homoserine/homoserine lactone efflux protein
VLKLLLSGALLGLSIDAPLGPVNIQQIRQGLAGGFWPSFVVALGAVTADTFYFSLVAFGLAPFVFRFPVVKTALWAAGTLLLLHLAFSSLRGARQLDLRPSEQALSRRGAYLSGLYICLTNPMSILLWSSMGTAAFASAGLAAEVEPSAELFTLYFGVLAGILSWATGLSLLLAWGRRFVTPAAFRFINLACGLVLAGFALHFGRQALRSLGF